MAFIIFLALVLAAAAIGSVYKPGRWYASLKKPQWTPPNWAFPVAWSALYLFMAVAGWLIWRSEGSGPAIAAWALQLIFNGAWSWLFFGLRQMTIALVDIVCLWLTIATFIFLAWPASPLAAILFVPYLLWVSFAAFLNLRIRQLNSL
ncbi:TspO/MBR family protein [Hoeflea prorocentri]|uniref:Tryptophan-rich sensory protein n=1 Tax=Hoeflea prorocentri TaxID=1922333 RepID=A0A9X3UH94_9HYPH|nr:TspO/MBR family protein [Hoeflea prorocentri]MCY6380619.1 tryptophan-rich sensory protein [Hoeflea prorocentri]MDA5398419.1 tryptophan-rich sensory protein [Hoeflea prorocentri]